MPLEQGRISAKQLTSLLINYLIPTSLIFSAGIEVKQDAWIAVMLGIGISLGFCLVYLALVTRFPGRTLIEINDAVWGPWLGKAFSIGFLLFYLFVTCLAVFLTTVFEQEFLSGTPYLVLTFVGLGIAFIMVSCGLEVIARCSEIIIFYFQIPTLLLLTFLLIPEIKLENLRPLFQTPFSQLLHAALRVGAFSFGTGFIYLMIFPYTRKNSKIVLPTVKAFGLATGFLTIAIINQLATLGPVSGYYTYPFVKATRLINIGEVFTRMEVITGIEVWLWNIFHVTMFSYNLTMATGELFRVKSYRNICMPLWLMVSLISAQSFFSSTDMLEFAMQAYQWLIFPFQYIIPVLTLGVALFRKLPRENCK